MRSVVRRKGVTGRILILGVLLLPMLYVSTCSYVSHRNTVGFETIKVGDAESEVFRLLGKPSLREESGGRPFDRYSSYACIAPCITRLWYENPPSLVGEAWSIELDARQRVIKKGRWVSP